MKIAILGATSEIAKDLILSFSAHDEHELVLFARRPKEVMRWLSMANLSNKHAIYDFESFHHVADLDAILNFVGAGDPSKAIALGGSILKTTETYDYLALEYLKENLKCKYIFMSSGAVYGENFIEPASASTQTPLSINQIEPDNYYTAAKIQAELRHRNLSNLDIIDLRIFSYFSHTQSLNSSFFMTDIMRALKNNEILTTSSQNMVRDYLSSTDLHQLIQKALLTSRINLAVDCYSKAPVDKFEILSQLRDKFGLRYQLQEGVVGVNASGNKLNYYSLNHSAQHFGYVPSKDSITSILTEAKLICHGESLGHSV